MTFRRIASVLLLLGAGLQASYAPADGPGGYGARRKEAETEYQRSARDSYGMGYALIESADRLDQDADAATDERTRRTATARAKEKYEDALRAFNDAARLEPGMYEAHTYIGYANRKLGRYDQALAGYAAALQLKPDYAPAIEYQGEAYLGLNRFEQARFNYLRLYAVEPAQARKLLDAMDVWVNQRKHEAAGVAKETIDGAADWIASQRRERKSVAVKADGW
jgi:tetratricopeptide (TPR) repeat protein